MIKNSLLLSALFSVALMSGCQSNPERTGEVDPISGLQEVKSSAFDKLALESPEKMAKYKAIYVAPLDLSQLEIDTRRLQARDRGWTLSEKEKAKMAGYFADSVISSFQDSPLPLARTPGEHVLTAEISLVKFIPSAPKDDLKSRTTRTEVFTYNVGELEMTGLIRDSVTGAVVGSIEDTQEVGDTVYLEKNDRINNTRKLKNTFNKWGRGLVEAVSMLNIQQ